MENTKQIKTISDVVLYWRACVRLLDDGLSDQEVASHMINIASSIYDDQYGSGNGAHPAYQLIFELAASLELPPEMTGRRSERLQCILSLLDVLDSYRGDGDDSAKAV